MGKKGKSNRQGKSRRRKGGKKARGAPGTYSDGASSKLYECWLLIRQNWPGKVLSLGLLTFSATFQRRFFLCRFDFTLLPLPTPGSPKMRLTVSEVRMDSFIMGSLEC